MESNFLLLCNDRCSHFPRESATDSLEIVMSLFVFSTDVKILVSLFLFRFNSSDIAFEDSEYAVVHFAMQSIVLQIFTSFLDFQNQETIVLNNICFAIAASRASFEALTRLHVVSTCLEDVLLLFYNVQLRTQSNRTAATTIRFFFFIATARRTFFFRFVLSLL